MLKLMTDMFKRGSRRAIGKSDDSIARRAWTNRRAWMSKRAVALCLVFAVLNMLWPKASQAAVPERVSLCGEISAAGAVKVDGLTAFSGQTFFSGNSISTARKSSAVVNLGKLGRIELMEDSAVSLSFDETSLTGRLDDGSIRLSIPAGVHMTMATKGAAVSNDDSQPAVFSVSIERGQTILTTHSGRVSLRANGETQQVVAGHVATAGPDGLNVSASQPKSGASQNYSGGKLAALLLLVGGVIATAAIVFTGNNENRNRMVEEDFGGPVIVPS
jgi:ferric-dicitrate binding protein FerR (iron transport regulator)